MKGSDAARRSFKYKKPTRSLKDSVSVDSWKPFLYPSDLALLDLLVKHKENFPMTIRKAHTLLRNQERYGLQLPALGRLILNGNVVLQDKRIVDIRQ